MQKSQSRRKKAALVDNSLRNWRWSWVSTKGRVWQSQTWLPFTYQHIYVHQGLVVYFFGHFLHYLDKMNSNKWYTSLGLILSPFLTLVSTSFHLFPPNFVRPVTNWNTHTITTAARSIRNAHIRTFQLDHYGPTDQQSSGPTDGWTDGQGLL